MTPADLRAAGEALYGARWQTALARAIGRSGRTVRRWEASERAIGAGDAAAIRALLIARRSAIDRLVA